MKGIENEKARKKKHPKILDTWRKEGKPRKEKKKRQTKEKEAYSN